MSDPAKKPSPKLGCAILLGLVTIIGVVAGAIVFTMRAGGETLAAVPVADAPASATFHLDGAKKLTMWTEIDFTHGDISTQTSNTELPHVLDYAVVITRGGEKLADLHCNPFASDFAKWTGKTSPMGGANGRSYDGLINGCELDAGPGDYVVTAKREWVSRDPRFRFAKTDLIVRGK